MPVISDLVVDMGPFYDRFNTVGMPFIRRSEFMDEAEIAEGLETYTRCENCIECNLCVSACPIMGSDETYIGPAALAATWRVVEEPRGLRTQPLLDWVDSETAAGAATWPIECNAACPSEVYPATRSWPCGAI